MSKVADIISEYLDTPKDKGASIPPEAIMNVRNLAILLVDIEYQKRYGESLESKSRKLYSNGTSK